MPSKEALQYQEDLESRIKGLELAELYRGTWGP